MKNKSWVYILIMVVLVVVVFNKFLFNLNYLPWGDLSDLYFPKYQLIKESIFEYKSTPLWNPYYMGGKPFFAVPSNSTLFSLFGWLILIFPAAYAVKLNLVLSILLGGIGIYFLTNQLIKNKAAAFISAIVYMFNGYMLKSFVWGWITNMNGYALIPFVFLFFIKAYKKDTGEGIKNIIIAALFLALLFYSDGGVITLYTLLAVALFLPFLVKSRSIRKVAIISVLLFIFFFGLIAYRYIPIQEYLENTGRTYTWEEIRHSRNIVVSDLFTSLVSSFGTKRESQNNIGLISFILVLFSLPFWRKKVVLYLWLLIITSILIATGSYFVYILWKFVPGWTHMRYLDRAAILFVFASSILAAYGFYYIINILKKKLWRNLIFGFVILLTLGELTFGYNLIGYGEPMLDITRVIEENQIMNYISEQRGIFRIHTMETISIDYGTEFVTVPLKLENLYGYESVWDLRYLNTYLKGRYAVDGMNVKYITSMIPLNMTGFRIIGKFNKSDYMFKREGIQKIQGPYLYENEDIFPRAYFISTSLLALDSTRGPDNEILTHRGYTLIKGNYVDLRKSSLIFGESLEEFDYDLFDCIILLEIDKTDIKALASYKGILIPDIRKGETLLTEEEWRGAISQCYTGSLIPIDDKNIITNSFNKKTIKLNKKYSKGWLVLSEKYSLYDWKSSAGKIYTTNGVLSSVYIDKPVDEVVFEYKPNSIRNGKIVTIITLIIIIILLVKLKRK